jgi:hypothetical protein
MYVDIQPGRRCPSAVKVYSAPVARFISGSLPLASASAVRCERPGLADAGTTAVPPRPTQTEEIMAPRRIPRRAVVGGLLALLATGACSPATVEQQPAATPTPEDDNEVNIKHPHTPRGPASDRGYVDTSIKPSRADTAYELKIGDEVSTVVPLPKLEAPTNDPESIKRAFSNSLEALVGMLTALVNPDPVSQAAFNHMVDVYATEPAKMRPFLMRNQNNLQTAFNVNGRKDIAAMVYDTADNPVKVANKGITNASGEVYSAMVVVGGELFIRGLKLDPANPANWQRRAGVVANEGYTLGSSGSVAGDGYPRGAFLVAIDNNGKIRDLSLNLSDDHGETFLNSAARAGG